MGLTGSLHSLEGLSPGSSPTSEPAVSLFSTHMLSLRGVAVPTGEGSGTLPFPRSEH